MKHKLDGSYKAEIDQEYAEVRYAMKPILKWAIIAILVISILSTLGGFAYRYYSAEVDRIIFKETTTYNEGVLDDLAKYKLEMLQAETMVEKKAIASLVVSRFANYDESKIETSDLREFLKDCRNLDLENYILGE